MSKDSRLVVDVLDSDLMKLGGRGSFGARGGGGRGGPRGGARGGPRGGGKPGQRGGAKVVVVGLQCVYFS